MNKEVRDKIRALSIAEMDVLAVLWKAGKHLTKPEINDSALDKRWKESYLSALLERMVKKGVLRIEGSKPMGLKAKPSRLYAPAIEQSDYQKYLFEEYYVSEKPFNDFLASLLRVQENKQEYVEELDSQMKKLKDELIQDMEEELKALKEKFNQ